MKNALNMFCVAVLAIASANVFAQTQKQNPTPDINVVKYVIEQVPNPDVRLIHLNKRVAAHIINSRYDNNQLPSLMKQLQTIDGIVGLSFNAYTIQIEKGVAFNWEEVMPKALNTIKEMLVPPNGEFVQLPSRQRNWQDPYPSSDKKLTPQKDGKKV